MVQNIIPGTLIALAITVPIHSSPISSTQPGYQMVYETTKSQVHIVEEGDSLGSIAAKKYGDSIFWTVLWNDNAWIEDPSIIEKNWELQIRDQVPSEPEKLKPEIVQKLNAGNEAAKEIELAVVNEVIPAVTSAPVQSVGNGPLNSAQINFLGSCEAGMDPAKNTGNGYYGAFQFSYGTWKSMGTAYERADIAPLDVQIDAVQRLLQRSSIFTQFPACARKMKSLGII